eukprot:1158335-Pelagomonas_calceolata.AAC.10
MHARVWAASGMEAKQQHIKPSFQDSLRCSISHGTRLQLVNLPASCGCLEGHACMSVRDKGHQERG